jgi:hypothetical protein
MNDFTVSINKDFVEVRLQPSSRSPRAKLGGAIFSMSIVIVVLCALLFLPGKNNAPSMWQDMADANIESGSFQAALVMLIVVGVFLGWLAFRWSVAAWPSDENFHCDRTTLTISRVPYLDFRNRTWKTRSYALRDITKFRFAVYVSAKGSSIYGFCFYENDTGHKILPGLEAPEALNILKALQSFGVDVVLDDKLRKKAAKALEQRGNQSVGL